MTTQHSTRSPAGSRIGVLANTLIVAGGYLLSRLLGLGRDIIISYQFGTNAELDAYRAAFGIPDLIYLVVAGGALGSAFIPVFSELLQQRKEDAWRLASGVLTLMSLALVVGCVLIAILAEPLVALTVGSGFDQEQRALTAHLLRLLLLQPVLLGLGGLAKATLESFDRFTLPAIGSNLYNLGIIGGALLAPWLGIDGLVWGVIAGAALFLIIQLPGLRAVGAHFLLRSSDGANQRLFDIPGLAQIARLILPRLFGQSVWQINLIAITSFATLLGSGAVAANGYALQLMMLPHGLLALSLGTVIFPQLARSFAAGEQEAFRTSATSAIRTVLFLALPASVMLGVLGVPVVRVLFERGAFDAASTALTSEAVQYYMFGLAAFTASEIAVRTFYAMQDTKTPVLIGSVAVACNILLGWIALSIDLGLRGLALAFSIANTIEALLLVLLLGRRVGGFGKEFWWGIGRMVLATAVCLIALIGVSIASASVVPFIRATTAYRWPADFLLLAGWLVLAGGVGGAAYAGAAAALRIPELRATIGRFRRNR